jgi:hypothetical protein
VDVRVGVNLDVNFDGDGDLNVADFALVRARQLRPLKSTSPSPSRFTSTSTAPSKTIAGARE